MEENDRLRMLYLGCLGLLSECSIQLGHGYEADETRALIIAAIEDAQDFGIPIKYKQILHRIELEVV